MEVAVSWDCATAFLPGQEKWNSVSKKKKLVAHTCNPSTLEAKAGGSPEVRSSRPAWPRWWNPISPKNTKISWAWWQAPVIPATREAEAGELLEPREQRLQWAEIMALHSCLGDRVRLHLKKQNKKQKKLSSVPVKVFFYLATLHSISATVESLNNLVNSLYTKIA